ncbi:MAG: nuclear transport factor 2 family protein [Burkholderiaceae bacterium]
MTSPIEVATAYIDTWNCPETAGLDSLLERHWTPDASYVDPLMRANGYPEIGRLVAAVHQRFPGFSFKLLGLPNGFGEFVRLSWTLGPEGGQAPIEGSDIVEVQDGRIRRVVGFIDRAPQAN